MDPMTMMAVAQAGYQVYALTRRGGGGIEQLLAAQVRMLREISAQVDVVRKQLELVYEKIDQLQETARQLPRDTALRIVKTNMGGFFHEATEIFATRERHRLMRGQEYALDRVREDAEDLLRELTRARGSLIDDGSETLCPSLCAAWYIELTLRLTCARYDGVRIEEAAKSYERILDRWITDVIEPTLAETAAAVVTLGDEIRTSERYLDHACYHSIRTDRKVSVRGGREGERADRVHHTVSSTHVRLSATPAPVRDVLAAYGTELATLASLGVETHGAYGQVEPYLWAYTAQAVKHQKTVVDDIKLPRALAARQKEMQAAACSSPTFAASFVEDENARAALAEELFARTVVYGYYLLVCRETLQSVRGVLARAKEPIGSQEAVLAALR